MEIEEEEPEEEPVDDDDDDVEEEDEENEDVDMEEDDDAEIIFPYEAEEADDEPEAEDADDELEVEEAGFEPEAEGADVELEAEEPDGVPEAAIEAGSQRPFAIHDFPMGVYETGESSTACDPQFVGGLAPWALRRDLEALRRHERIREAESETSRTEVALVGGLGGASGSGGAGGSSGIGGNANGTGVRGTGPTVPKLTGCTYATFIKCDPLPFIGTEGAVVPMPVSSFVMVGLGTREPGPCRSDERQRRTKTYLKLFFPQFSGEDPQGWVYQAEQYFEFQKVAEGDRIALASFYLDEIALQWHRWYTKAQGPVTWAEFTKALLVQFGPTDYEDPSEALHRLKQSTTVVIYQETYERLSNRVKGLPESFLVGCFIGGLKDEIRLEVKLKKPRRLVEAMGMARLVEEMNSSQETADEVKGEISFHAISGTILPQTLWLPGRIQNKDVVVDPTINFSMVVDNREKLACTGRVRNLSLVVHGCVISTDFFMLLVAACPIVLGVQWLKTLGPIEFDFNNLTMRFHIAGSHHKLHGLKASELSTLKSHELMGICDAALLLKIFLVLPQVQPELFPSSDIQMVLTDFCKVFQEPSRERFGGIFAMAGRPTHLMVREATPGMALLRLTSRISTHVVMTTSVGNNSVFRSFFEKLFRPNFIDWYRQLRLVLSTEDKENYLEHPILAAPVALPGQQVPPKALAAHAAWVKGKKEEEGQSVSSYMLKMKSYIDNLESLGQTVSQNLAVSLILVSLNKDYDSFTQNYNMHGMRKTVNELHVMLKLHEDTLPKKDVNPALYAIRSGRVQKNQKNKPHKAAKEGHGKGKGKMGYTPNNAPFALKPKTPPPPKKDNPAKDAICHQCGEGLRESKKLKPCALSLYVGDGHRAAVKANGTYHLELPSGLVIVLNNCHYALSITRCVILVSRLFDGGFINRFDENNVISVLKNNLVYFMAVPRDGIFEIDMSCSNTNDSSMYAISNKRAKINLDSSLLWHCRLGHISKKCNEKLQHDGLLNSIDIESLGKCVSCLSGKMERKPYSHQVERAKDLLVLIHTDVCGPFRIVSRQRANYFVFFTDNISRYGYVYLLKHEHEVFETFKVFQKEVENQLGKTIKSLRSDREGEYMSQEFLDHLKEHGIIVHRTPPYTPQHNGVSERRNQTLIDMVRSMMIQTTLPKSFWDYTLETAARILNMVPTKKVDKTPYEIWHGQAPKLSYLKVWVSPSENKVFVAQNAEFFENDLIDLKASRSVEDLELIQEEDTNPSLDTSLDHEEDDQEIDEPQSDINPIQKSSRIRRASDRMCLYINAEEHELADLGEPANYKAALLDLEAKKLLDAINVEMQSMKYNDV
nr:hypothetical protein [Tanacetum cinerariifolium]